MSRRSVATWTADGDVFYPVFLRVRTALGLFLIRPPAQLLLVHPARTER